MDIKERLFQEKAVFVLILFLGLLIFDPLIPGTFTNLVFPSAAVFAAYLLSTRGSLHRKILVFASGMVLIALAVGKLFPLAILTSVRTQVGIVLLVFTLILYALCMGLILQAMLKAQVVTHQLIISGLNIYIMLGIFYAHIYTIIDWLRPESFALDVSQQDSASHFIYFSFVTLSTLGYGDITPKTEFAQRLAITEAMMGQFYGSVVIAYLLSVYIGDRFQSKDSEKKNDT